MNQIQAVPDSKTRAVFGRTKEQGNPYPDDCRAILAWLDQNNYAIELDRLQAYLSECKQHHSPRTYNKRVAAIRHQIKFMLRVGGESMTPKQRQWREYQLEQIKPIKIDDSTKVASVKTLSGEQIKQLIDQSKPELSALIYFLAATGTRISEALSLRYTDFRLVGGMYQATVVGKGDKARAIRIKPEIIQRIRTIYPDSAELFPGWNRKSASIAIRRAGIRLLGVDVSAHSLRHSYATIKIQQTGRIDLVSQELGHASLAVTQLYYNHDSMSDDDRRRDLWD